MERDLANALGRLLRAPGFAFAAVLSFGLGVAAATVILSGVHAVKIRPLPYPEPDRLVSRRGVSFATYSHYRELSVSFDAMAAYRPAQRELTVDGASDPIEVAYVTASFFDLFQPPVLGRVLSPEDERPGATDVAVMSHRLWQQRYSSDPSVIGQPVLCGATSYHVVGVMARGFDVPAPSTGLWMPLKLDAKSAALDDSSFFALGRLKPGIGVAQARAELENLAPRLYESFSGTADVKPVLRLLKDDLLAEVDERVWIILGALGVALLITGASVANLVLVRADVSRREGATHTPVAARPQGTLQQFLAESLFVAIVGSVLGALVAVLAVDALVELGQGRIPRLHEVGVSPTILGCVVVSSAAVGLLVASIAFHRSTR